MRFPITSITKFHSVNIGTEILDFGFPQIMDFETLKLYITSESVRSEGPLPADAAKVTIQATGATSWRRADIKYRRNEVYIDVIEEVNVLMSNKGTILSSDVAGTIRMKAYLSGNPECKFGLNERGSFDKEKVATAVSPSGPEKTSSPSRYNLFVACYCHLFAVTIEGPT
jgi:hypothetical protein